MTPRTMLRILLLLASIPATFQEAGAQRAQRPQPPRPAAAPQLAGDNLFKALYKGDGETARKLVEQNPSLVNARDEYGETPLHVAATFPIDNNVEVVKLLLAKNADVNARDRMGETPLHAAAQSGIKTGTAFSSQPALTEYLLSLHADVNARDNEGNTPLHSVLELGNVDPKLRKEMVNLLLAHKADVNAKNNKGETPLKLAAELKDGEIIALLRQYGAK